MQYELKLVFQYLIKNSISLSSLSERIMSLNYGYTQRKNRPSGLKLDDNSKDLGLNAVQSWCLLHNTPLMFGDLVCRNYNKMAMAPIMVVYCSLIMTQHFL